MRFGLLGTGYWATEAHGAALLAHPEAELVAVWGRDPAKATALAERLGVRACADVDSLLSDVDAVAIALPPDIQADLAVRAAKAGRHLFLDKPLALSTADADRVVAAVSAAGVASIVFFTNRFYANVAAFLNDAAAVGDWDGARATVFGSIFQPGNPFGGSQWRREKGGLWDVGPHALSIVLPVLGPAAAVTALDGPHDTTHVLVKHRGGAVTTMALTVDSPVMISSSEYLFYGGAGFAAAPAGDATAVQAACWAIGQLMDAVREGRPDHPCDARFGRDVVEILAAADTARQTGTIQLLPGS